MANVPPLVKRGLGDFCGSRRKIKFAAAGSKDKPQRYQYADRGKQKHAVRRDEEMVNRNNKIAERKVGNRKVVISYPEPELPQGQRSQRKNCRSAVKDIKTSSLFQTKDRLYYSLGKIRRWFNVKSLRVEAPDPFFDKIVQVNFVLFHFRIEEQRPQEACSF